MKEVVKIALVGAKFDDQTLDVRVESHDNVAKLANLPRLVSVAHGDSLGVGRLQVRGVHLNDGNFCARHQVLTWVTE